MKVEKKNLNEALRVIGKVVCQTSPVELYRAVRFVGDANGVKAMATDGIETVTVTIEAEVESPVDFCVPYRDLKELIRINRTESMELTGKFIEFPQMDEPDPDVITTELPENFCELLANAAAIVDRNGYRQVLQGINLSSAGITATDGKQLLHLPCALSLDKDVTIPFPAPLLALKGNQAGMLHLWDNHFLLTMNHFEWRGRLLAGEYPNWRLVIPSDEKLDYSITLLEPEKALSWVKMIPNQKTTNGVELNVMPDGSVMLVSSIQPTFKLPLQAQLSGVTPQKPLILDRDILLRMLLQGYTTFRAHSESLMPVIASGGRGEYIAMPIRTIIRTQTQEQNQPTQIEHEQENTQMEEHENVVESQNAAPVVNPLDELNANVEEFRGKLKLLLDESGVLIRKVKEVALIQRQKERDFIQARRAIERIRMAI